MELDKSMRILERCMSADNRKRFHAITYGKQAIQYFIKFGDEQASEYLLQAKIWLSTEIDHSAWDIETKQVYEQVMSYLS